MHIGETVQLAGLVALHGRDLIQGPDDFSASGIEQYWASSKCRLDRWGRTLKFHIDLATSALATSAQRAQLRGAIREILSGEMLTRVWAAVGCAYDRRRGQCEVEPVVRSVLIGHLEARHRALKLIVQGPGVPAEAAVELNQHRRRVERWTDVLIGRLAATEDVTPFAFDPERSAEFGAELNGQTGPGEALRWGLAIASLNSAFPADQTDAGPNADLNAAIASSILACFPPQMFDGSGVTRIAWQARLFAIASDTQGLITQLFDDPLDGRAHRRAQRLAPVRFPRPDRFER